MTDLSDLSCTQTTSGHYALGVAPELPLKPHKQAFAAATLRWVAFQLAMTTGIVAAMCSQRERLQSCVDDHRVIAMWIPVGLIFVFMIAMYCTERPWRLIWFGLFGAALAWVTGLTAIQYTPASVLLALGVTTGITILTSLCACYCARKGISLSGLGPALAPALGGLCLVGVIGIFVDISPMDQLIAGVSVLVFTGYLMYDIEQLYTRLEPGATALEDPIYAAATIYLDILNIFVNLLELLGRSDDD